MASHTAGIIIIGDEILKGQVADTNSHYLCKRLHSLGIKVCKTSVVSDDVKEIAAEVASFSQLYGQVFTSGGIGPTHDDVTYLGVAQAFDEDVKVNEEFAKYFVDLKDVSDINDVETHPALKMAEIPQSSTIIYPERKKSSLMNIDLPIIKIRNVYILPGIPQYFECLINNLDDIIKNPYGDKFFNRELYLNAVELTIIPVLNVTVEKFKGSVVFGSYPELNRKEFQTKIILESKSEQDVDEAEAYLRKELPAGIIVNLMEEGVYRMLKESPKKGLSSSVNTAVKVRLGKSGISN